MFSSFLWSGEIKSKYASKVTCKDVCKPKKEGGLGILNLESWNKSIIIKNLWDICQKKDSIWIKWVQYQYAET